MRVLHYSYEFAILFHILLFASTRLEIKTLELAIKQVVLMVMYIILIVNFLYSVRVIRLLLWSSRHPITVQTTYSMSNTMCYDHVDIAPEFWISGPYVGRPTLDSIERRDEKNIFPFFSRILIHLIKSIPEMV